MLLISPSAVREKINSECIHIATVPLLYEHNTQRKHIEEGQSISYKVIQSGGTTYVITMVCIYI